MLVLFFIVLIGILLAVNVYVYDNSQFSKITGHSLIAVWLNKEVRFFYKIAQKLKKVNGESKLLFNIVLPESEHKIDYLFLHQSGVYVVSAVNLSGWINGNERDFQWAQVLERGQMNKFQNPIIENKLQMMDVKQYIPDIDKELFHSLIVFNNSCSFKKIEVHSPEVEVIKINEIKTFWEDREDHVLSKDQLMALYTKLDPYMQSKQPKEKMPAKDATSN